MNQEQLIDALTKHLHEQFFGEPEELEEYRDVVRTMLPLFVEFTAEWIELNPIRESTRNPHVLLAQRWREAMTA